MAPIGGKRRSVRQAATRKRSRYYEPETDDDFEVSERSEVEELLLDELPAPEPRKRQRITSHRPVAKPQTRSHASTSKPKSKSSSQPRKIYTFKRRKPRKTPEELAQEREYRGPSDGRVPDWCSLPESILRDVFIFASYPLHVTSGAQISQNASWLMKAARTCRAFSRPALEAFYRDPALVNEMQPHDFLYLLREPKQSRHMDYNVKVRRLDIDVKNLAYQAVKKPMFDVRDLIPELPQLQHIEIKHPVNEPPFRPVKCQKWTYPPNFFSDVDAHGLRLRSWRWTREMIVPQAANLYQYMSSIHESKSFETLTKLTVCGFDIVNSAPLQLYHSEFDEITQIDLNTALSKLPNLRDLTLVSSNAVRERFLDGLPKYLHRLELCSSHEVNSEMLALFLKQGGSQLRELVLNHNPVIDLAFLPTLRLTCPKLETLIVNIRLYSEMTVVNDAEALFDDLLLDDEIPLWPTTIRHIELTHLQKFASKAAENLFGSLVDQAHELPDLRCIILNSHIDIPWRDRAGFRDKWIDLLRRVYKRRDNAHIPYLGSLRQFRQHKRAQMAASGQTVDAATISDRDELAIPDVAPPKNSHDSMRRNLSHVRITPQPRRSRRVAEVQLSAASASATPAPESPDTTGGDSDEADGSNADDGKGFVQGRCEVVDITIDNQRPREQEFKEADFLDSEMSGDEDWHEGADGDGSDGYAW
ncbi:hypothetical protein K431DRAFT_288101 [Polychaeton citri CBS 116435]|uniref:Uncharacterized protein n=1 Tax=Polychaeton citri CBS 116435 TaxID=1314669 RepID=A0A9P4Q1E2_9PEZI|nr:hypothetical protein K431DRAFT_288101 [Polychaeton citri CBS 116435]